MSNQIDKQGPATRPAIQSGVISSEKLDLIALLLEKKGIAVPKINLISRRPEAGPCRLSFAQERLWFLHQLDPSNVSYNLPGTIRLSGQLKVDVLEKSFREIIKRHEALRTTFAVVDATPIQIVNPPGPVSLPLLDLSALAEEERESRGRTMAGDEAQRPFDLSSGPLLRMRLLKLGEEDHLLLWTMHHIISDGWSMGLLITELTTLYNAYSRGEESPLRDLRIQYADYAHWQRNWLQDDVLKRQLTYWKRHLAGAPQVLELPSDRPRPSVQTSRGASHSLRFSETLSAKVKQLSKQEGVTLFMILLAAFQTLLSHYTAQDEIVVGTPSAGRGRSETDELIGFFVNTLVLRTDLSGDPSFVELLRRVKEVALGAYDHQDIPFEKLVEEIQPAREMSRSPLFQVMIALQNAPGKTVNLAGLKFKATGGDISSSKFDLTLSVIDGERELTGALIYNTDLFDGSTTARMLRHLETLLEGIVEDPERRLSELPLLTHFEQQELQLRQGNQTETDYSQSGPAGQMGQVGMPVLLHKLFEAQVERTPEAVAVIYETQQLSYSELNQRANQLAHYLQSLGVAPGTFVALCLPPSVEMIVVLLAILKAGAAYLPLDPVYPRERLTLMLSESHASLVITEKAPPLGLYGISTPVLSLDSQWELINSQSRLNPHSQVSAEQPAYLIFTSGSTGTPKAAAVCHSGFNNLLHWYIQEFSIATSDHFLLLSSISFDLTQKNIFAPLLVGARLSLSSAVYDAHQRAEQIKDQQITFVNCTPSAFYPLVEASEGFAEKSLGSLRQVILGGERISLGRLQKWLSDDGVGAEVVNSYGPTECTDVVSYHRVTKEETEAASEVPLGRPIWNTQLWVADKWQRLVPVGVVGELWIGGTAVGLGYVADGSLTSEKFRPDQWSGRAGARVYRSGDMVRYLGNGEVHYLGRMDEQVKVRGYRIELGEVEAALVAHSGVREAVVLASAADGCESRLVAYVVAQEQAEVSVAELRSKLEQSLPPYMVPSIFMMLERLPLTPSGKVDRRALPVPDQKRPELAQVYIAPRSELERAIVKVWQEVLGVEKVGVHDNFFDLGGHSLLMVQVHLKLREVDDRMVTMLELFQYPTIDSLATYLKRSQGGPSSLLKVHERAASQKAAIKRQRQLGRHKVN